MPPHCDSMDGPVVLAAKGALDAHEPKLALPYVKEDVHRAGEGAPYTGLKPAGLGFGPVVPVAERAIDSGSPDELVEVLTEKVRQEVLERFGRAMTLKPHVDESVATAREYVEAMLGLEVWSHKLYACASAGPHEEHGEAHEHES